MASNSDFAFGSLTVLPIITSRTAAEFKNVIRKRHL